MPKRCVPQLIRQIYRSNLQIGPPGSLVAVLMQLQMMITAEWHGKFVADLPPKRPGLGKFEMMGITWRASTDDTGLRGNECEMGFITLAGGLGQRKGQFRFICQLILRRR